MKPRYQITFDKGINRSHTSPSDGGRFVISRCCCCCINVVLRTLSEKSAAAARLCTRVYTFREIAQMFSFAILHSVTNTAGRNYFSYFYISQNSKTLITRHDEFTLFLIIFDPFDLFEYFEFFFFKFSSLN